MPPPFLNRDAGFTLVEILVVISIIALLVGLVLVAGTKLRGSAKVSQARSLLGGLNGISAEYEVRTGKPVVNRDSVLYQWDQSKRRNAPRQSGSAKITGSGDTPAKRLANLYSERFVFLAYQVPTCREALERLGSASLTDKDDDGFLELRDPWGQSIAYAFQVDHDTASEDSFLREHNDPFFASAGEDQRWGQNDAEFARDNLYSFDLVRSTGTNNP